MNILKISMAVALCASALATSAFATIQPSRVGPVSQYGALQAGKNSAGEGRIYGSVDGVVNGKEVQVKGMSLTWSMYWPYGTSFYGNTFIDTLVGSWNVELIRSAMGVVPPWGHGTYMELPEYYESQMDSVVQAAIENDVYVLIDWHSEGGYYNCIHKGTTPAYEFNDNKACFTAKDAAAFFGRMAERYGKYPHVIFEIYNEPVSESWADLKAYADTVIAAIRPYSSNLVVVGTPMWSSMAGDAVANPIKDNNVAYTYHFYANLHKTESHLTSSNNAMAAGLSVFVTEWGGIDEIFSKNEYKTELEKFLAWTTEKKLSYAKWDVEKPYLENNDVDNYIKANILPAKTSYTKRLNWETEIKDNLPNLVTFENVKEIAGTWKLFGDDTEADPKGNKGTSTFNDNSADGIAKMDNIHLDAESPFEYSPYVKADYTFSGTDLSSCKLVEYTYKGANHQFTLYYDWNESEAKFGAGDWDFPYVTMPLALDWETVRVDLGWALNNRWQAGVPERAVTELVRALRFNVTEVAFKNSLWIKDVKCIGSVEGYTPTVIPEETTSSSSAGSNLPNSSASNVSSSNSTTALSNFVATDYRISLQGKSISVAGISKNTRYALTNTLGQVISWGIWSENTGATLKMTVPNAGLYVLRIGNMNRTISIK